eukprot:8076289-Karenia_brevis.AAC.1
MLVQVATDWDGRQSVSKSDQWFHDDVRKLIQERRNEKDKERRKALSKEIKKASRKFLRKWADNRMSQILEEFSSLDRLQQIGVQRKVEEEHDKPSDQDFANMLQS